MKQVVKGGWMRKLFAIKRFELGWAFTFCGVVTGIGSKTRRYFDTKEELVTMLDSLGIGPSEYDER